MMFCRVAWQRLAPLARKTLTPFSNATQRMCLPECMHRHKSLKRMLAASAVIPMRQMSFGLPVSSTNIAYMVLGGSSLTAALVYAYKTINSDSARYNERIAQLEARPKSEEGAATEEASVAEAAELTTVVEATAAQPVIEVIKAEDEQTPDPVDATLDVGAAATNVEAVAADAEEPTAPVVEDVAAEAASPSAETPSEASSAEEAV